MPSNLGEIAKALGLSRQAVSRAINGRAGVSEQTRQRVLDYLAEIGYVPSQHAVDLRRGRGTGVGILGTPTLYNIQQEALLAFMSRLANKRVYPTVIAEGDPVLGLREAVARGVDRLIWLRGVEDDIKLPSAFPEIMPLLRRLRTVIYNYRFGPNAEIAPMLDAGVDLVGFDRGEGFRKVAALLKKLGHQHVAIPLDKPSGPNVTSVLMVEILAEYGIKGECTVPVATVAANKPDHKKVDVIIDGLCAAMDRGATAAMFLSDVPAGYCLPKLLDMGIRVPEDLTVVCYPGVDLVEAFRMPLTRLRAPIAEMIDDVLGWIDLEQPAPQGASKVLEAELVERGSHGPPPTA